MTPKKAEQILDSLGVDYERVTMAHTLVIKFKDGSRVAFKKFLREHASNVKNEVSDLLTFEPTPIIIQDEEQKVNNEVTQAPTEVIVKKKRKNNK